MPIEPEIINPESLGSHPAWLAGNVLDVRNADEFLVGHVRGAVSIPVPVAALAGPGEAGLEEALPSIFLPPRHEPLLVTAGDCTLGRRLAALLRGRGRAPVDVLDWRAGAGNGFREALRETGPSRRHLWRPPHYLVDHLDLLPPPAAGPVLDLACGSGRAVVWLADRGYRVTGVDWQPEALEMGRRLAEDRGVACRFLAADLRSPDSIPAGPWAAVLNFRFLQRELLEAAPRLLQPRGVFMARTFRDAPGYEGHPHRRHRLRSSELIRFFPAGQFEILAHEENHDPDGRPAAGVVARRRMILPGRGK